MNIACKLIPVIFLLPLFSIAQSNYRAGYVVTSKGDTVKGFIDYQAWDSNPTSISFKSALADREKKTFSMGDMSFFSVDGIATYKKFVCKISTDITDPRHVIEGRGTSFRIGSVFLKVLQKGKNLALYNYTDNLKTRFYIGEAPDYLPTELTYRIYIDRRATAIADNTVTENIYQKQLFALANKYNALDEKMTALLEDAFLKYATEDLLKIVSLVNGFSNTEFEEKYGERTKLSFYAGVLANASATASSSGSSYTSGGGNSSSSLMPGAVFGMMAEPNPGLGKMDFRLDLSINPSRFNTVYALKVIPYGQARATYNQLGIYINPHAVFNIYSSPAFKFYLGLGASVNFYFYSDQYFESQGQSSNPYFPKEPFYFNEVNVAFLVTGGFRIGSNWEIYFNYFTPTSTTSGDYFYFSNQIEQLGVSYFFNLK